LKSGSFLDVDVYVEVDEVEDDGGIRGVVGFSSAIFFKPSSLFPVEN